MINVVGILAVNRPGRDGLQPLPLSYQREAVTRFAPVPLILGHNASDRVAEVIGTVDQLVVQSEGWGWRGRLHHDGAIRALRQCGELPTSAEFRPVPDQPQQGATIAWPMPTMPSGIVVAVAVLAPWELPAFSGSAMWAA